MAAERFKRKAVISSVKSAETAP